MSLSPPGVRLFYDPRGHHAGAINELCWGLEEQGVPCQTITYDGGGDAAALGALAARSSPLRVGIGLSASGEIALYIKRLLNTAGPRKRSAAGQAVPDPVPVVVPDGG